MRLKPSSHQLSIKIKEEMIDRIKNDLRLNKQKNYCKVVFHENAFYISRYDGAGKLPYPSDNDSTIKMLVLYISHYVVLLEDTFPEFRKYQSFLETTNVMLYQLLFDSSYIHLTDQQTKLELAGRVIVKQQKAEKYSLAELLTHDIHNNFFVVSQSQIYNDVIFIFVKTVENSILHVGFFSDDKTIAYPLDGLGTSEEIAKYNHIQKLDDFITGLHKDGYRQAWFKQEITEVNDDKDIEVPQTHQKETHQSQVKVAPRSKSRFLHGTKLSELHASDVDSVNAAVFKS